jgi:Transglycosylase SLT domain
MHWPRQFAMSSISAAMILCAFCVAILPASAAELAILRNGFSIRHEHRLVTGAMTRLYLGTDDTSFTDVPTADIVGYEKDLTSPVPPPVPSSTTTNARAIAAAAQSAKPAPPAPKSPVALSEVVNTASATYHLDPDLVNSVIHAESGFNAHAVSPKGARGLMQLMPQTAGKLGVSDAFDPEANVTGGSRYLRELLERYNFDLIKALAAYNAGPERVEQYQGVPPFRETRAYVARIVHEYNTKKIAQEKEARKKAVAENAKNHRVTKNVASTKKPSKLASGKTAAAALPAQPTEAAAR